VESPIETMRRVGTNLEQRSDEIGMLSVNRAKGLDALAVLLVDYGPWQELSDFDPVGFFMGASRARQLLAIVYTTYGNSQYPCQHSYSKNSVFCEVLDSILTADQVRQRFRHN
jgi:hypothetical protein